MKTALLLLASLPTFGQLFGPITDAPQHVLAVGAGVGHGSNVSGFIGVAEKLPSTAATYSYSGIIFLPSFADVEGKRQLVVNSVLTTGLQQVIFQRGRLSVAVDAGAGASLPAAGNSLSFSGTGAALIGWRFGTSHYLAIRPSVTQTPYGPIVSIGIGYAHGIH